MARTALARRYRPRRFSEVATQEHVSETLRRAVVGDRVGHAYLFCGPRGVGKTTLARVLAMALNCAARTEEGEPCGECQSCERIWAGTTALDVVEIDAASNRGVDDARELRSRAMYAPSDSDRFKVYIVDEAHMLTREAWNALLKVLEEPPDRVIFIFATTEPEKIEQTAAPILSRCQRFDFRRLAVPEIVQRLGEVLAREGTDAPDEALRLIARKADGGMRDALSLTDQVLSLSGGESVGVDIVRRILGVIEEDRFLQLFDLLSARDRPGLFTLVEDLLDQGYDLVEFYNGLLEGLRTLLRLRVGGQPADLPADRAEEWRARADRFAPGDLVRMLGLASELETRGSLRRSSQPRVLLELLLLRFSYLDRTVELEELLGALGSGAALADSPRVADPPVAPNPPAPAALPVSPARPAPKAVAVEAERDGEQRSQAPEPEPEGSGQEDGADLSPRALLAGWKSFVDQGDGIPAGFTPFLRGGSAQVDDDGALVLTLPPSPALERLRADGELRRQLESGLAAVCGGHVPIRIIEASEPAVEQEERISQGEVRAGRLGDLLEKEPDLRGPVEGWDLEIVD